MTEPIAGALNRLPVSVTTSLFDSMLKSIDVVTSDVPGAPIPIYIAGADWKPTTASALAPAASNITLLSYIDDLHLAVSTDPAAVADPDVYTECLQEGLDEIEKLG